jgi:hypothetical protein
MTRGNCIPAGHGLQDDTCKDPSSRKQDLTRKIWFPPTHPQLIRKLSGVALREDRMSLYTRRWYMAWIAPIPPSPRHLKLRWQVRYQDGRRQRSADNYNTLTAAARS